MGISVNNIQLMTLTSRKTDLESNLLSICNRKSQLLNKMSIFQTDPVRYLGITPAPTQDDDKYKYDFTDYYKDVELLKSSALPSTPKSVKKILTEPPPSPASFTYDIQQSEIDTFNNKVKTLPASLNKTISDKSEDYNKALGYTATAAVVGVVGIFCTVALLGAAVAAAAAAYYYDRSSHDLFWYLKQQDGHKDIKENSICEYVHNIFDKITNILTKRGLTNDLPVSSDSGENVNTLITMINTKISQIEGNTGGGDTWTEIVNATKNIPTANTTNSQLYTTNQNNWNVENEEYQEANDTWETIKENALEAKQSELSAQEFRIDQEQKKIETQLKAITTQIESIQKMLDQNIKDSFGTFASK